MKQDVKKEIYAVLRANTANDSYTRVIEPLEASTTREKLVSILNDLLAQGAADVLALSA